MNTFLRRILFIVLQVTLSLQSGTQSVRTAVNNEKEILVKLKEADTKLVILEVTRNDCDACKTIDPEVEKLAVEKKEEVTFLQVNFDKAAPELKNDYYVDSVPTFILLKYSRILKDISGNGVYKRLVRSIDKYTTIKYMQDPVQGSALIKAAEKKIVVIEFTKNDCDEKKCGPLSAMSARVEGLAFQMKSEMVFLRVDVEKSPALKNNYSIESLPSFFFLNESKIVQKWQSITYEQLVENVKVQTNSSKVEMKDIDIEDALPPDSGIKPGTSGSASANQTLSGSTYSSPNFIEATNQLRLSTQKVIDLISQHPGQLVVLYFTGSWCKPCRKIKPEIYKLAKIYTGVTFIKIDVDEYSSLYSDYGGTYIPYFVFLKDSKKLMACGGALDAIKSAIEMCK